jgi:RimJ/RimL family protein N-acetyltransferase
MMTQLTDMAKGEWGCSSIHLYVDAPNESARAYYEKCGFHVRNIGMTLNL